MPIGVDAKKGKVRDIYDLGDGLKEYKDILAGRSMLVEKVNPSPVECIVRGYISGSAWNLTGRTEQYAVLNCQKV